MTSRGSTNEAGKQPDRSRMDKINIFALIWMQMYKNHAVTPFDYFENPIFVGNGMDELGFVMDCGKSLEKNYPGADLSIRGQKWDNVLKKIDIQTLGNAIFSQWRCFNHWSQAPMSEDDFDWFVASFARLAELSKVK